MNYSSAGSLLFMCSSDQKSRHKHVTKIISQEVRVCVGMMTGLLLKIFCITDTNN